jgi:exodeoxyribonuclease V alpha subunit
VTTTEPTTEPTLDPLDVDLHGARRPHALDGLLAPFARALVLDAADVHVAATLVRLAGEPTPEEVALAAALAVRAVRLGSVTVDLTTIAETATVEEGAPVDLATLPWPGPAAWRARLEASALVAVGDDGPPARPLRLVGDRLALDRYWRHERSVAAQLVDRTLASPGSVDEALLRDGLDRLFDGDDPDWQRLAAATAVLRSLTVVAGGPGTGKTTTVGRILALLHEQATATGQPLRVALAAPTGKAAVRLQEAVHEEAARMPVSPEVRRAITSLEASTLHRLLGRKPGSNSRFRHDRGNQLPHQVVVVDETSMVSLSMMAKLLDAVRPSARLVLVGDPQQLTSVEAGAVLGDIVGPAADAPRMDPAARARVEGVTGHTVGGEDDPRERCVGNGVVVLRRVFRFDDDGLGQLADAVREGDGDAVVERLAAGGAVRWLPVDVGDDAGRAAVDAVREGVVASAAAVVTAARSGDAGGALDALRSIQLLCAHRRGPYGVSTWRGQVEQWLTEEVEGYSHRGWYPGRPLLVTENDYDLELFNGDTGVVVDRGGRLQCAFERRGEVVLVSPSRLSAVETLYAMTIHKSQGSQFGEVVVVLPDETSPILTRELLYTAVTRAQRAVTVVGSEASVRAAVDRPVSRASGLRDRLWG